MGYPRRLLTEDESVVREFHPHWRVLIPAALWLVLGIAGVVVTWQVAPDDRTVDWIITGLLVVGILVLTGGPIIDWRFTQYVLTNERLIVRRGVISRSGMEIPLENVNDVRFSQSAFERMLRYGDVVIESAGEHGQSVMHDIPQPESFQSQLYTARETRAIGLGSGSGGPRDPVAQLEALARLHEQGVLTDDEFAAKKQRLLDQM
jgi:membrane protein YdbS with pleckstrin-like domain